MHAAADRPEFTPPPPPGLVPAVVLAVLAHLLLLLALAWGIHWKRDAENVAAEAELWSAVPQQAAPRPVEPPRPPPAPPAVKTPPPPPKAAALPSNADIALEREKKAKAEAQARQEELERQKKLAQQKLELQKLEQQKREALKKQQDAQKKLELAKKAEEDRKKQATAKPQPTAQQQEEARRQEAERKKNLDRMMASAQSGTGSPDATGTAAKSSGPSASYANRLAALFKSKIFYPNAAAIEGNPKVTVQVLVGPSGMILNARVAKSSGVPGWDEAALAAVEKTVRVPPDENGKFVSSFPVNFGPKDN